MITKEEGTNEVIQERLKTAKVIFSTTAIDIKLPGNKEESRNKSIQNQCKVHAFIWMRDQGKLKNLE